MSRLSILIRRPKSTLSVLAAVLAAVGLTVASGADFTAQTANPDNTFSAGNLSMTNSKDGAAIFTPSNMIPGEPQSGTVDIENSGTIAGEFSFVATDVTNSDTTNPIAPQIDVVVKDCGDFSSATPSCDSGDPVEYSGTLAGFTAAEDLGVYSADEKHRYEFTATLKSTAGDVYENGSASARFEWNATQE